MPRVGAGAARAASPRPASCIRHPAAALLNVRANFCSMTLLLRPLVTGLLLRRNVPLASATAPRGMGHVHVHAPRITTSAGANLHRHRVNDDQLDRWASLAHVERRSARPHAPRSVDFICCTVLDDLPRAHSLAPIATAMDACHVAWQSPCPTRPTLSL